jgi:hypothetical protein
MRCPKCGYISFDHIDVCLKCNKDISKVTSKLEGTTYNVAPPAFLKFRKREEDTSATESSEISFDAADEFDVVDPDLDVLAEDKDESFSDDATISFGDDFEGFGDLEEEESLEVAPGEDDDAGIDLGQFEDAFEEEKPSALNDDFEEEDTFRMDLPDELADISDLSAPVVAEPEIEDRGAPAEGDDFGDFSLDLELDDLDSNDFALTSDEDDKQAEEDDLGDLSLDDLGLTDSKEEAPAPKKSAKDDMDMDADLNFDLDLGGISLDKDE